MTPDKAPVRPESPATRLGTLYIASFFMIALLSSISQSLILRELSWQRETASSVSQLAGGASSGRSLSLAALTLLAENDPGARGRLLDGFRATVEHARRDSRGEAALAQPGGPGSGSRPLLARAAAHRLSAVRSADELGILLGRAGAIPPTAAGAGPLVYAILAEEEAAARAVAEAMRSAEHVAVARVNRLELLEFELFAFVLLVLTLEGLFVINPAVRKIRAFMDDVVRSNEGLKTYALKLERSNKELQDFASVASHDLQEPLRKVQAFSDRLRTRCGAALDDTGRDYLDRVQNASRRMQTLINDLLTYARVATKAQPFVSTDLAAVTREVLSDLEVKIEQVKGRVEVGELPQLDADPLQVRQLMQNLIGNALKYKRADVDPVVKVSGGPARGDPTESAEPLCQISVEDNGIGFDEVYVDRIFTIFQRLHGRTEYEGTGVGLAVCRKIAERHGGSITARSTPGAGSTFTVTLPMRHPKERPDDGCTI